MGYLTIPPEELAVTLTATGRAYLSGRRRPAGTTPGIRPAYFTLSDGDVHYGAAALVPPATGTDPGGISDGCLDTTRIDSPRTFILNQPA